MKNLISSDNWGKTIANGLFHNEADHLFLSTAIKLFDSIFINGKYTSSGPSVFTKSMEVLCMQPMAKIVQYNSNSHEMRNCSGMTVAESKLFFPYGWFDHVEMAENKPNCYWEEKFKTSLAVTYYGSSSRGASHGSGFPSVLRPNNYGRKKPALTYLGPKECPLSFFSARPF